MTTFEGLYKEAAAVGDDLKIAQVFDRMLEMLVVSGEAQIKNIGATRVVPHKGKSRWVVDGCPKNLFLGD